MPTLDRDGVKIHYESHGDGPGGDGPGKEGTILLTHGYSAICRMWDGQIAALKDRWRVVVWDMRGHGESDYPQDQAAYSEELTVGDMRAVLDACGVERAVIGGLSLGGYMTLAFHLRHPGMCRALMLFDTGPGFKKDEAREQWNATARARGDRLDADGLAGLGTSDEVRQSKHRSADGLANAARGMLTQATAAVIESLPAIAVPTLVLAGAEDKPYLAATDYMAGKITGARKAIVPGAGHAANLHQPALFNDAVTSFLAGLR